MPYGQSYDDSGDLGSSDYSTSPYSPDNPPPGMIWAPALGKFVPNGSDPNQPAINPLTGQPFTSVAPAPGAAGPTITAGGPAPGGDKGDTTKVGTGGGLNGGPTTLGGLLDPFSEKFVPPPTSNALTQIPPAPQFHPGADALPGDIEPFSYKDFAAPDRFQAPSWDQVTADPGFDFRRRMGEQSLTNRAAATGMARSGSTLKDFINYNQDLASQEYGNVYNRRSSEYDRLYNEMFGEWSSGLDAAANAWKMNTGLDLDITDRKYKAAQDEFQPQMQAWQTMVPAIQRQSEMDWERAFQTFGKDFDIYQWNKQWPYSVLSDQQRLGLSATQ